MPKPKTHFEQVPIEVVKKLVQSEVLHENEKENNGDDEISPVTAKNRAGRIRPAMRESH